MIQLWPSRNSDASFFSAIDAWRMVSPDWSEWGKIAYFAATALLFYTCYAFFSIPYQSLTYESSPDYDERTGVMAHYAMWGKVADLSSGWIFPLSQAAMFASPIIGIRSVGWGVVFSSSPSSA